MPRILDDNEPTRLCRNCRAPLCPRKPDDGAIWVHGQPICRSVKFTRCTPFVRVQRRIEQLPRVDGFFTIGDLNRIQRVRPGMQGRCPSEYPSVKPWKYVEKPLKRQRDDDDDPGPGEIVTRPSIARRLRQDK